MQISFENKKQVENKTVYSIQLLKKVKDSIEYYKKKKLYDIVYKLEKHYFSYLEKYGFDSKCFIIVDFN